VGVVLGVTDLADLTDETVWFAVDDGEVQDFFEDNSDNFFSDNWMSFREEICKFSEIEAFTGLTALAGEVMTGLTNSTFSELVLFSSSSSMYLMAFFLKEDSFLEVVELLEPSFLQGEVGGLVEVVSMIAISMVAVSLTTAVLEVVVF